MYHRLLGCLVALLLAGFAMAQTKKAPAKPPAKSAPKTVVSREWLRGIPSGQTRVIDLTYAVSDNEVSWPGDEHPFEATPKATVAKDGYFTRSFSMLEHYGTHLDAPIHFPPGKTPVDKIPPERLFGPAVVIDVREEAAQNADYLLTVDRIAAWEKEHGKIPPGAFVILRTGWSSRWPDVQRYRNMDAKGVMHFPGFSTEAVVRLILRKVTGLGIDTLSVDYGPSQKFQVHQLSHGAGLYHVENLADLSQLPEAGAFIVVAPIKLEGGSGGPCRVFAILP
jgi:kynurenine formamidase